MLSDLMSLSALDKTCSFHWEELVRRMISRPCHTHRHRCPQRSNTLSIIWCLWHHFITSEYPFRRLCHLSAYRLRLFSRSDTYFRGCLLWFCKNSIISVFYFVGYADSLVIRFIFKIFWLFLW